MTEQTAPADLTRSTRPATWTAFTALYGLLVRSTATRGRLAAVGALSGLSVLTAVIAHASTPHSSFRAGVDFASANLVTLVPVAVLVFGAGTIGDLVDDGSIVYLWLKPVPTWLSVVAAWAATVTITVPLVGVPVVLSTAVLDTDDGLLTGTAAALLVGIVAYAALAVTAGIRFRRALPWGLAYILLWEGFVAGAGSTATRLAIRSYLRSILSQLADHPLKLADFSLATGVLVPLAAGAVSLLYASRRLARTDVP
jgi:ABC-2 type transport system permease protein